MPASRPSSSAIYSDGNMLQLTDFEVILGYDSAHGHHHRHYRGKVTTVSFESFEQIESCFQKEWNRLAKEVSHEQD
jgi:hypothetical protein